MEQISSALLFPETEPLVCNIASLLFFFNSISFYLPTESNTAASTPGDLFGNLCRPYVPAPLHEDLARFNRLLHEMETSRSDDLARLFSAAKTTMITGQTGDKDEASSGMVFSALRSKTAMKLSAVHKERLWQARLILKLAELLDRREIEIIQGLARVALSEQRVFASLEGISDIDADDLFELPGCDRLKEASGTKSGSVKPPMGVSPLLAPLRVKAWAELFLSDTTPQRPPVLVAANTDCGSILLDGYEETWHRRPQKLFTLSLPTFYGIETDKSAKNEYMKSRNKLRAAAMVQLEYFENFFREAAATLKPPPETKIAILAEHAEAWNKTVANGLPVAVTELKTLDMYCLPGISLTSMFQKLFHLAPDIPATHQDHPTSVLAMLKN
jgi:hypothetical protein